MNKYAYDPYGKILNGAAPLNNPFTYVGRYGVMYEGNGFYYMRARFYNTNMKRFMNKDPYWGNIWQPGSLHRYAYVEGNPVNWIDPQGLYVGGVGGFGGGAISGNVSPGVYGAGSTSIVWDQYGNLGIAVCGGLGIAAGSGVIGGLAVTNAWGADTICDLEGSGVGIGGGGAGGGGAVGWGGFVEGSSGGMAVGIGYGIGGWSGYGGAGGCKVYPLYPGSIKCKKDCNK